MPDPENPVIPPEDDQEKEEDYRGVAESPEQDAAQKLPPVDQLPYQPEDEPGSESDEEAVEEAAGEIAVSGADVEYSQKENQQDEVESAFGAEEGSDESQTQRDDGSQAVDSADPREAKRVDDVDKAHDMAKEGHEFRSRAAESRDIHKDDIEKGFEAETKLYKLKGDAPSVLHPIARKKHKEHYEEVREAARDEYQEHRERRNAKAISEEEISRLGPVPEPFGVLESAEAFDKRADELEEWAGILHDNPVRVTIADGLEVEVTPEMMLKLEDEAKLEDQRLAELQESDWMESHEEMDLSKASGVSEKVLEELMSNADDETRQNIESLVADLNKTDLELRAKLAQLREQAIIEPLIAENEVRNKSLADIRAGAKKSEPESEPEG